MDMCYIIRTDKPHHVFVNPDQSITRSKDQARVWPLAVACLYCVGRPLVILCQRDITPA
jgi:hypothetical protein